MSDSTLLVLLRLAWQQQMRCPLPPIRFTSHFHPFAAIAHPFFCHAAELHHRAASVRLVQSLQALN
jgi:hypothetical protein